MPRPTLHDLPTSRYCLVLPRRQARLTRAQWQATSLRDDTEDMPISPRSGHLKRQAESLSLHATVWIRRHFDLRSTTPQWLPASAWAKRQSESPWAEWL